MERVIPKDLGKSRKPLLQTKQAAKRRTLDHCTRAKGEEKKRREDDLGEYFL
jgi:hypothetical protein